VKNASDYIRTLERRLKHVNERAQREGWRGDSYDRAEAGALRWAIDKLRTLHPKPQPRPEGAD
jgi:hypothetical protein